jgi:dipeptidyl aminopeptidase/acylaminoacyl peptidase
MMTAAFAAAVAMTLGAAAPSGAVVIAHEQERDQPYLVEFSTGRLSPLGSLEETVHQPVWSPDGKRLAFRTGDKLWLHGRGADAVVAEGLEIDTQRPCAFSPDGRRIAVAGAAGKVFLLEAGVSRQLLAHPDLRVADLLWSPDGRTLFALLWARGRAEVERIALSGEVVSQPANSVSRLLGFRSEGALVVLASPGEGREQPALLTASGVVPLRELPEELTVVDAAAGETLVLAASGEDSGDDATIFLAPAEGKVSPRRWLASHPQLTDLRLSADGQWALCVDRAVGADGRPGGSVYRVAVGSEKAARVLSASAARSFSAPVPRPDRRR